VGARDTSGGTRTGMLGTYIYAAPEQLERPQDVDARADVHGLGMTLAFAIHGERLPHRAALGRIQADLTVGGSHFLPEMVIAALKRGVTVIEVPVNYRGRIGESKITGSLQGTLRTGFRMIALILHRRFA